MFSKCTSFLLANVVLTVDPRTSLSYSIQQTQSVANQSQMNFYNNISNGNNVIVALNDDGEFQVVNGIPVELTPA